jgi:hypothetical protein
VNQVRIYHAGLDTHVSVPESAVDIHRASGWIPADEYVPPVNEHAEENSPAAEEKKPTKAASRRTQAEEQ